MRRLEYQQRDIEQEAKVVAMRSAGLTNAEIARALILSRERVRFIYDRWSREQNDAESPVDTASV